MFTGIIEQTGKIIKTDMQDGNLQLWVAPQQPWKDKDDIVLGESIAHNGACLTVAVIEKDSYVVELSQESINKTADSWQVGQELNLERAVRLSDRLGGHLVSGHVDGTGEILSISEEPGAFIVKVKAQDHLAKYLVPKGSITVDGVSLTVVDVGGPAGSKEDYLVNEFSLWLVPHTLEVTSLKQWQEGHSVNLEADQMAKYAERILELKEVA